MTVSCDPHMSHPKARLQMILLILRWDMLVPETIEVLATKLLQRMSEETRPVG